MSELFSNQSLGRTILKHRDLPIFVTDEFNFFRCVTFSETLYEKTVSELHSGNLRSGPSKNRYSKLFPNEQISYWADSYLTARAEIKHHNGSNNLLRFWAYDDATSTFPTIADREPLILIDGRDIGFNEILLKIETEQNITSYEKEIVEKIASQKPDCLVYESLRRKGGLNYLFFEKGFRKLSIRQVHLRLGDNKGKRTKCISCADTCDYSPNVKNYGVYFSPIVRTRMSLTYQDTEEYKNRLRIYKESLNEISECYRQREQSNK